MALFYYKEKKNKGIRAAAYLRLSIEDGDKAESNSIGNQRELIQNFVAERPELHLVGEYADDGYVIRIENEDECSCDDTLIEELSDKLTKIESTIDDLLTKYEEDHKQMNEAYNDQEIPTCVKVEADTVYYNLTKVLNTIKDIINE